MPPKGKSNRDKYHGEVVTSLHNGARRLTRSNPTASYAEPSSADVYTPLAAIEIKTGKDGSFSFEHDWRPDQREWAEKWCRPTGVEYWLWVVYDKVKHPDWSVKRAAFLVPYPVLIQTLEAIKPCQMTLPYQLFKNSPLYMKERRLEAIYLWRDFALQWGSTKDGWIIGERHPFRLMYLNRPLLYQNTSEDLCQQIPVINDQSA